MYDGNSMFKNEKLVTTMQIEDRNGNALELGDIGLIHSGALTIIPDRIEVRRYPPTGDDAAVFDCLTFWKNGEIATSANVKYGAGTRFAVEAQRRSRLPEKTRYNPTVELCGVAD